MNKHYPVILLILLISCGGGDATTPALTKTDICIANTTNHSAIDDDSIKISVEKVTHALDSSLRVVPANNVVVQLDNNGPCIRTNTDGFVTFTALNSEPHDIHIFSPAGLQWISEYNIEPGELKKFNIGSDVKITKPPISYATLTGTINNKDSGTVINILVFPPKSRQQKYITTVSADTNSYSIDINFDVAPGLTLATDIIILEYRNNPATGDLFVIDTKLYNDVSITTAATINTNVTTLDIDFTVPKPQQRSTLLNFNSITLPMDLGLTAVNVTSYVQPDKVTSSTPFYSLFYQYFNQDIPPLDLSSPITFKAFDQFKVGNYQLELNAKPQNGSSNLLWRYFKVYSSVPVPATVTPKINVFPSINSDESADTLNWNSVNEKLTEQYMRLYSKDGKLSWRLNLDSSATSVKFPKIPKGIRSRLFSKQNIELIGQLRSPETSELEEYTLETTTWTQ